MRERALLKQALESNKTTSRKARERIASGASSKAGSAVNSPSQSRATSRTRSRQVSDDDDYTSDETTWSTNSIDGILNGEDVDVPEDAWKAELNTRIEQITNLKRSSTEGRAESLRAYSHILMARYAKDDIQAHLHELLASILRSIKQETTTRETVAALKALAVTALTADSDAIYEDFGDQLRRSIQDSESNDVKINALHALGITALFAGAGEDEVLDIMNLCLEIVESDGASVGAQDDGDVVIAALEAWGVLATDVEDLQQETEAAMDAFVEQLESSDVGVQIAAGENIALLYEKSYTPLEDDESVDGEDNPDDLEASSGGDRMVKRYQVYRRQDQLLHTLDALANVSTHRISRKDRKILHASFRDIRNTVEKPTRGPGYSTSIDDTAGIMRGSTMRVKIDKQLELIIDHWWKLQLLNAIRRTVKGGLIYHYRQNSIVNSALPSSWRSRAAG